MLGQQTFTERRAEVRWPRAIPNRNSGPNSPIQARSNLSRNCAHRLSDNAGIFGQTVVQQQRIMVKRHERIISIVPRPFGDDVHPANAVSLLESMPISIFERNNQQRKWLTKIQHAERSAKARI